MCDASRRHITGLRHAVVCSPHAHSTCFRGPAWLCAMGVGPGGAHACQLGRKSDVLRRCSQKPMAARGQQQRQLGERDHAPDKQRGSKRIARHACAQATSLCACRQRPQAVSGVHLHA